MVYYVSSYDIFSFKTLSGAASESGERQKAIFAEKVSFSGKMCQNHSKKHCLSLGFIKPADL